MIVVTTSDSFTPATAGSILCVNDLRVGFGSGSRAVDIVKGVSFTVQAGRTLAIVGESGSGKSMTALSLLGLLPAGGKITGGTVELDGLDLVNLSDRQWQDVRSERISMIFQDPLSAMNPVFTVGSQVAEIFRIHRGMGRAQAKTKVVELFDEVGIPDAASRFDAYPHEFSGGMRQRAIIAMALALEPAFIIADEPTTALDVTVQAQILRLLRKRQQERGLGLILISHDLGVVARSADDIAVMYAGRIVETGTIQQIFTRPAHPYTRGLMEAIPDAIGSGRLVAIDGQPPDLTDLPSGCSFNPRCPFAQDICRLEHPLLRELGEGRASACHFAERVLADDVEQLRSSSLERGEVRGA
jgi:oligopeptide transport system ATP-binding protein